ncbi:MAG TPA: HD domain-containing phosphohydrolase [Candidatus Dormibacteraeota bacterium]|nr:HD domain-containing phosphohydrolase [Candidatus Dormibacteraeota bacterium]
MIDAVKTAAAFHIYVAPGIENSRVAAVLAELGLEGRPLPDPSAMIAPALILLAPGEAAPEGLDDSAIRPPADAPPAALREILRVALQNAVLRLEVKQLEEQARRQHRQFEELNRIGIALSAERDIGKLQVFILTTMRQLTNADGASLWLKTPGEDGLPRLFLASSQNSSLDKDTYQAFTVPVDEKSVVGYTVTMGASQIYEDAYNPPPGKPPGGRGFDAQYGYRTKSMLTVPMRNYNDEVVGAIQLINAKRRFDTKLTVDTVEQEVVSFRPEDLEMIESIASQAAVAIDNKNLLDAIQNLFDGFVQASVTAIEQRDPITAGHSNRVETLTTGIARAVTEIATGKYGEVRFSDDQFKELRYACLLHDFGKVGVSENILQKEKKLKPGQLPVIQARFEFVQRSVEAKYTSEKLRVARQEGFDSPRFADIDRQLDHELKQLRDWLEAIAAANEPSVLPEDKASMLEVLSMQTYEDIQGELHPLLADEEFRFLSIRKGTLDPEERLKMESHVTKSWEFLRKIPWTPVMKNIPDIAYGHHEKLNGSGYPRGLHESEIPLQAKMMTISDIYDALTAADRPYKPAVSVERALAILYDEADKGQLDRDLIDLFAHRRLYELTAER